jgi:polyisoprenoid-binding protein YceI
MALHDIPQIAETRWEIDPGSTTVELAIGRSHLHRVRGRFHAVRGSAVSYGDKVADAAIEVEIDAASIDTRLRLRDHHLRGGLFLDVRRFPAISFGSTRVEDRGEDGLRVIGDLTIHGITQQVALDAEIEQRDAEGGSIIAHTVLDRRDFKIGPRAMGIVVGNQVAVKVALALRAR